MADHSSQNPSAARLQGSGEIVHRDLGPRGHHRLSAATLARKCRTSALHLVLALAVVSVVSLAAGAHDAAAAALTVEGGEITDVPPDSDWSSQLQRDPLCRTPGWRAALEPTPAGEALAWRAERRTIRA